MKITSDAAKVKKYLEENLNKNVWADLSKLSHDELKGLKDWKSLAKVTDLPEPADGHDKILTAIVMTCTVVTFAAGVIAAPASAGTSLMVSAALIGGGASIVGNAFWLNWTTSDSNQTSYNAKAINILYKYVIDNASYEEFTDIKALLNTVKQTYDLYDEKVDKGLAPDATTKQKQDARAAIISVNDKLTLVRNKIKLHIDGVETWGDSQTRVPQSFLDLIIPYTFHHTRFLMALLILADDDEYEGSGDSNGVKGNDEVSQVVHFLNDLQHIVLHGVRKHQNVDYFASQYSISTTTKDSVLSQYEIDTIRIQNNLDNEQLQKLLLEEVYLVYKGKSKLGNWFEQKSLAQDDLNSRVTTDMNNAVKEQQKLIATYTVIREAFVGVLNVTSDNPIKEIKNDDVLWPKYIPSSVNSKPAISVSSTDSATFTQGVNITVSYGVSFYGAGEETAVVWSDAITTKDIDWVVYNVALPMVPNEYKHAFVGRRLYRKFTSSNADDTAAKNTQVKVKDIANVTETTTQDTVDPSNPYGWW